ncbi:MAG: hypothetical protein Q7J64_06470 [Elusimicrobiota bacterium]|nr:hypothetical protein [Elusimicrobiota bacterium]
MAPDRHVIVFEAANDDLKEVYVAWTSRPIFQAKAELDARPPSVITHWHPQHQNIAFRSLEFNLPEVEAQAFITRLVAKHLSDGRKYVTDSISTTRSAGQHRRWPTLERRA